MSVALLPSPTVAPRGHGSVACAWCGAAMESGVYCCPGCENAAALVNEAGLERYFAERSSPAPRPEGSVGRWADAPVEVLPDGSRQIRLCVDGLRCASCVWVTEKVLQATPGVQNARVSYGTGRAELRWDPALVDLDTLAHRISGLGYHPRLGTEAPQVDRDLMLRLGVAIFGSANAMMIAVGVYLGWFTGMDERYSALFRWSTLLLATPVALWSAVPFYVGALSGLRARVLHMDLPVALAVAGLYVHGLFSTLAGQDAYLDSMTMLVALLLGGRMLEQRGRRRALDAARALAARVPVSARRERAGVVEAVRPEDLVPGDTLLLAAGEEAAADGVVLDGGGEVQMALVTGESAPVNLLPGDRVVAGALVQDGALRVRVEASGSSTLVARMAASLGEGAVEADTPPPDGLAPAFTAGTLVAAVLAAAIWMPIGGTEKALPVVAAVLVVACPCALALSKPLVGAVALGSAARRGLMVRSSESLLALAEVDRVILDKTGTVTRGEPRVVSADDAVIRLAAGLERASNHPVARAVLSEAARRQIPLPDASALRELPRMGVEGVIDGVALRLRKDGPGSLVLERQDDGAALGRITLEDLPRPDATRAIAALKAQGLALELCTGDHAEVAERVAREAGLETVHAGVDPEGKAARVKAARDGGAKVLFVGDGLNDGPALAAADVGIAMGGGAAPSLMIADGVVAEEGLGPVAAGIRVARVARRALIGSRRRSVAYNLLAVGAAMAGWVDPLVAAILMPLSSGMVVLGALWVERSVAAAERAPRS